MLGAHDIAKLQAAHVLVVGLGGVGGMAAEMLARAGVGTLTLIDADSINESNINRQIMALHSTIGKAKVEVTAQRLRDINPEIALHPHALFLRDQILEEYAQREYSAVIDAIDTLSPKMFLIITASRAGNAVVSAMGAGGRLDPRYIRIGNFWEAQGCHLARSLRKRFRRIGFDLPFSAVYSTEPAIKEAVIEYEGEPNKKSRTGVISYMPNLFGSYAAAEAIRIILERQPLTPWEAQEL